MYRREQPARTAKGRAYDGERRKARCKSLLNQIMKLMEKIESHSRYVENVHYVENDLQILAQMKDDLRKEFQSWLTYLDKEEDVRHAHKWYEEKRHGIDTFISGMKDWTVMAKDKIEQELDKCPSDNASVASRQSSLRTFERARVAELVAQSALLERRQALRNQIEKLDIEERIAVAKARERAIIEATEEERDSKPYLKTAVGTPETAPVYLPSQMREANEDEFSMAKTFPGFHIEPPSFTFATLKEVPGTPKPRRTFNIDPTPSPIKMSPIPSSVATKNPIADIYRNVKRKDEIPFTSHGPTYDFMTPMNSDCQQPPRYQRQDEVSLARFLDRQNKLTEILTEHHQRSLLPPLTLSTFTNDPADFTTFISSFESQIESKVSSCEIRLRYLEQYLEGEAKNLIKGCRYKEATAGYPEAKKLLREKYGDPYKISNAYIKKVSDWPVIIPGDDAALDHLSTFLTQCVCAMESISYLSILDHTHNLQNVVRKLPLYLQDRWRRHVITIRESENPIPSFKSFADFITKEAKVATDPVFSKEALTKTGTKEQRNKMIKPAVIQKGRTYRATNHAINVLSSSKVQTSSNLKCILCSGDHDLDDCKQYKDRTLSERKKFLTEHQMCYGCYKPGHRSRGCIQKRKCTVCEGRHPTGLHDYNFTATTSSNASSGTKDSKPDNGKTTDNNRVSNSRIIASEAYSTTTEQTQSLPIVPVKLQWMDNQISTYAMLDSCSTGTFITEDVYKQLMIQGADTSILLRTMNGQALQDTKAVTGLKVSDLKGENCIELPRTFTRESIPSSENDIPPREMAENRQHLNRIADQIPERLQDSKIGVLIGTNCPKAIEPRDFITSQRNGPYAVLTFAGWTIVGPLYINKKQESINSNRICVKELNQVKSSMDHIMLVNSTKEIITPKALNSMMELEFNERMDKNEFTYSQDDRRFLKIVEEGTKYENGHYSMPLPFRDSDVLMPCNKEQAISRATWIKNKLLKNPKMHEDYANFMNDLLDKNYARGVPSSQALPEPGKVWYLPHHAVYHPHKPEKIRVVFDCSARYGGISLNSKLLQGPDLTCSLVGVLTRFRAEPIAFQADIEAMFHQVRVAEEHRNFLRFLWWPNGDLSQSLHEYQMNVHLFGAISSPSCANYAVRKTADDTENEVGEETADVLRKNFYVDDCLRSEETEEKAIQCLHSTIATCLKGGFRLTKITSNSRRLLESISEEDRSKDTKGIDLSLDNLPVERALGVQWHIESDTFGFKITLKDKPLTRRGVLSTISSVYDPLGFAAPVLLPGKRILQELCRNNINWDDPVSEEYVHVWERWRSQLSSLERFHVARCVKPANFGTVIDRQIHNFSDASASGYGQVSYLRQVNSRGEIHCAFLMGKARLSPIKPVTVPRMELTAAVVSCKIGSMLFQELGYDVQTPTYWTDSTTVLKYINKEQARYQVYVANRVQTIRDKTEPEQWRYVPGKENPADDGSRGLDADKLNDYHRWIKGPEFLWKPESEWPEYFVNQENDNNESISNEAITQEHHKTSILGRFNYFSQWPRLKRVVAWILRLIPISEQATAPTRTKRNTLSKPRPITVEEMEKAEKVILKIVQQVHFASEITTLESLKQERFKNARSKLKKKKVELKRSSTLCKLDPIIDEDGLVRVGGRLGNTEEFAKEFKHPVILPKKDHITTLVIRYAHEKMAHAGRGITLSEIRSNYWIINANSAVRGYITNCVNCRKHRGIGGQQKMADLPKCRITPEAPFTYCAVDFFGPFLIKEGRKELKRYGAIFTCLSSRA